MSLLKSLKGSLYIIVAIALTFAIHFNAFAEKGRDSSPVDSSTSGRGTTRLDLGEMGGSQEKCTDIFNGQRGAKHGESEGPKPSPKGGEAADF